VDDSQPAIDPPAVTTTDAQAVPSIASDRQLPLAWLLPWLLALTGILITLALTG